MLAIVNVTQWFPGPSSSSSNNGNNYQTTGMNDRDQDMCQQRLAACASLRLHQCTCTATQMCNAEQVDNDNCSSCPELKPGPILHTSLLDVCSCDASLVEVLRVNSSQRVEQGMPGGVIAPVTHVQAADETYEPPLAVLVRHVALGPRGGPVCRAVVPWAAPPQLLQLVLGPGTLPMRLLCACGIAGFEPELENRGGLQRG